MSPKVNNTTDCRRNNNGRIVPIETESGESGSQEGRAETEEESEEDIEEIDTAVPEKDKEKEGATDAA
jgi:hypothetical protein